MLPQLQHTHLVVMWQSPPSAPATIGSYWTDEQIVMCLDKIIKGALLPVDVIENMNPYQSSPSNLPEGIWYLLHSHEKKETELGSWKERGEACRIYEDSKITGWRTTLEFFEGVPLALKKTDWVMLEYKITQNRQCEKTKPKDCRILCTVFNFHGEGSSSGLHTKLKDPDITYMNVLYPNSTRPSIGTTSAHDRCSSMRNMEVPAAEESPDPVSEAILELYYILMGDDLDLDHLVDKESRNFMDMELAVAEENPDPVSEAILELDYILRGDYLELDDLIDNKERGSSLENCSCVSVTSDACYDSLDLFRDLEDDINKDLQEKASNSKFSVVAPSKSDKAIVQPANPGFMATVSRSESP